jgi:ABC-type glycerol-3-phosphate transport system substrate-binding protein
MRRSLLSIVAASALLTGAGLASAQTTTTTTTQTWTTDQGQVIREYSTTKNYQSFSEPGLQPQVGMELPSNVTLYPLPETMQIQEPQRYSYTIINNAPVVVERTTRRVVHTWP